MAKADKASLKGQGRAGASTALRIGLTRTACRHSEASVIDQDLFEQIDAGSALTFRPRAAVTFILLATLRWSAQVCAL
jgi:hypothetical protein